MTFGRPETERLLNSHGLRPRRSLGQNFVADPNTVRRIVRLAEVHEHTSVVEIGAGLGALTLALAEICRHVLAVEIDPHLVEILHQVVPEDVVTVVNADALRITWHELLGSTDQSWKLVANLPYNVATPVVMHVLERAPLVRSLFIMVQREVAERMVATTENSAYGAVSVKIAYWATSSIVGKVPATVFVPRPRVESSLVRIDRRPVPAVPTDTVGYERLTQVIRAGFAHRRKMLRRSLSGIVDAGAFEALGVSPEARAEELGIEQWGELAAWSPRRRDRVEESD